MFFVYVGGGPRSMALSLGVFLLTTLLPSLLNWSGGGEGVVSEYSSGATYSTSAAYSHGYTGSANAPAEKPRPRQRSRDAARARRQQQQHSPFVMALTDVLEGDLKVLAFFAVALVLSVLAWQRLLQYTSFAEHQAVRWLRQQMAAARRQIEAAFDDLQEHIQEHLHGQAAGQQRRERADEGHVQKLPTELFATEEDLKRWSVSQLKDELRRCQRMADMTLGFSGGSETRETHRLLTKGVAVEKSELVQAVVTARGGESGLSCAICLANYESNETLRVLRCGHRFHSECVDKWLVQQSRTCPLCSKRS